MERDILCRLDEWKASPYRKPLILKGARQVGKTWALKEFGATRYRNYVYVSLEEMAPGMPSEYAQLFETTRDPKRVIANLSFAVGQPIDPGETLVILDEIQDCPAAVGMLKYFCDEAPEYHIACAGSLLGVRLTRDTSAFPVGKVDFFDMYPMSFSEYLRAVGVGNLDAYMASLEGFNALPDLFANQLRENLCRFFAVGGMPEAVVRWAQTGDMAQVDAVLANLLDSYERDFAKHGGKYQFAKISLVWNSLPAQLARENKKFMWGLVREGARAREYEDAVEWLVDAGLLQRVRLNAARGIPLSAYDDGSAFKAYGFDVGLLRRHARLDAAAFADDEHLLSEFKGAFAEDYVLQSLVPQLDVLPRYWTNEKPKYEVDFLLQVKNTLVPVEVKAGEVVDSPSLRYYTKKHADTMPLRVRFSMRNLAYNDGLLNIPLYLAHRAISLIEEALGLAEEAKLP